jgi:hypothetical protein
MKCGNCRKHGRCKTSGNVSALIDSLVEALTTGFIASAELKEKIEKQIWDLVYANCTEKSW